MKKKFVAFASFIARSLPLSFRQALYRFPLLAQFIRTTLNASVDEGLSEITVAAGALKGYKLRLNLKAEKSRWLGTYEPDLQAALGKFIVPGSTVYDVGANIGYISLMMANKVGPQGQVFAFEALPINVDRIQKNIDLNNISNVKIISAAVLDKTAPVTFYVHDSVGMGKAAGSAGRQVELYQSEISVAGISLDDFVFQQGNPAPVAVKMDIEGGEVLALPGMCRLLREYHPLMLLELHGPESEKAAWDILTGEGYRLHLMENGYPVITSPAQLSWKAYLIAVKEASK